jgi:hypothetical protein
VLLSGGKNPGKPFKKFNFEDICELFSQVRQCDVLGLDNTDIELEPEKGIAIIETYSELDLLLYTKSYQFLSVKDGYIMKPGIEHLKKS